MSEGGETDRITERADGAVRALMAITWSGGLRFSAATTCERAIRVLESQRDEILALNAYIDSIENPPAPTPRRRGYGEITDGEHLWVETLKPSDRRFRLSRPLPKPAVPGPKP